MNIPLKKTKKIAYILGTGDLLPLDLPEVLPGFGPDHHLTTLLRTSRTGSILNTTEDHFLNTGGLFLKQPRIIFKITGDHS